MKNPKLIVKPFAKNGQKNVIPENYETSMDSNQATWDQGFSQITMLPVAAGGLPPKGQDFNGILNQISENIVYQSQGGRFKFSPEYAESIGGYPKGAILQSDDEKKEYQSLIDNNKVNFNTTSNISASWELVGAKYAIKTEVDLALLKKFDKANISGVKGNDNDKVPSLNLFTTEVGKLQPKGDYAIAGYSYSKSESDSKYATNDALRNTTSQTIFDRAIVIPLNADLNDYLIPGLYFQPNGNIGENSKNYPSNSPGSLEIIKTGNSSVKQVYTDWYDKKTYTRRYNGGNKTWADRWDEDYTKLNPPTAAELNVYSIQQADSKFQPKGNYQPAGNYQPKGEYVDKNSTQEQIIQGFLTATRRLSVEAPDKARAVLYAVTDGNVGITAQDSTGRFLGDIKHPGNGKNGTFAIVEQLIGEGQKWVNVTSERQSRVTYTNDTSRPILVCVTAYGEAKNVDFLVNDTVVALIGYNSQATIARPLSVIVPVGAKYRISDTIGYTYTWSELR
ncbi:pyocin knob domain-containing protein [Providencia sp. wls1914]|uniref:pyocin knob domain-containing protein n=1 Tax=Providencia sp. wls1914 TaxID=2675156 RepID=UPI0012B52871|nr:hypothetical protein [Providencia sp. wls1914]